MTKDWLSEILEKLGYIHTAPCEQCVSNIIEAHKAITAKLNEAIGEKYPEVGVTENQISFAKGANQAIDQIRERLGL